MGRRICVRAGVKGWYAARFGKGKVYKKAHKEVVASGARAQWKRDGKGMGWIERTESGLIGALATCFATVSHVSFHGWPSWAGTWVGMTVETCISA